MRLKILLIQFGFSDLYSNFLLWKFIITNKEYNKVVQNLFYENLGTVWSFND